MTLILVRHGQTAVNRAGLLQGRADAPLTELGAEQAARVAASLAECGATSVVTSPLQRAVQTAAVIAARLGLAVRVDERLVELDYGEWDERPLGSIDETQWAQWRADPDFTPPGGESLRDVSARAIACADELLSGRATTIAVSHVSPIKAIVAWALGAGDQATWRMRLDVASVCRVGRRGPDAFLLSFNERDR